MKRRLFLTLMAAILVLFTLNASAAEAPKGERIVYGTSGEGRELEAYRYGSGDNVLVIGFALHGFEDNFDRDGEALVYTAKQIMAHLEGSYLPDSYGWTVYILPCMNPDGLYSGWTMDGPGRCTTTYLSNGKLVTGKGIDMNRCFPARFSPQYNSRNYTSSTSMACLEAQAISDFIQEVKGSEVNVLIDVHGWYQQSITTSSRISSAFNENFPNNTRTYSNGGTGYLMTYAHSLGYESGLLELPAGIYSMSQYKSSSCVSKVIGCVEDLIRSEPKLCDEQGHQYVSETTVKPTCTAKGTRTDTCKYCGTQKTASIPATGHSYAVTKTVKPTCTDDGYKISTCGNCGSQITSSNGAATGHKWDKGVVTKAANCTDYGEKTYTCTVCGSTKTGAVAPNGKHVWSSKVTTAPTCTKQGVKTYTCTACGTQKTASISAIGHSYAVTKTVKPTCTDDGYQISTCGNCGGQITSSNGAATGHKWDKGVVAKAAACTEQGEMTYTCESCEATKTAPIAALGHEVDPSTSVAIQHPTACRDGLHSYCCARCGTANLIDRLDRIFTDAVGNAFYSDPLDWCYEMGYINGTAAHTFSPNMSLNRAMLVTILYRYHGSPEVSGELPFTDVPEDAFYADPVKWGCQAGIINGVSDTEFAPDAPVAREQVMAIFFRYVRYLDKDNGLRMLEGLNDLDTLNDYAVDAAAWSIANGILQGDDTGMLRPLSPTTRAQGVTILWRLDAYLRNQ